MDITAWEVFISRGIIAVCQPQMKIFAHGTNEPNGENHDLPPSPSLAHSLESPRPPKDRRNRTPGKLLCLLPSPTPHHSTPGRTGNTRTTGPLPPGISRTIRGNSPRLPESCLGLGRFGKVVTSTESLSTKSSSSPRTEPMLLMLLLTAILLS